MYHYYIALNKMLLFFQSKSKDIFLISPHKHALKAPRHVSVEEEET